MRRKTRARRTMMIRYDGRRFDLFPFTRARFVYESVYIILHVNASYVTNCICRLRLDFYTRTCRPCSTYIYVERTMLLAFKMSLIARISPFQWEVDQLLQSRSRFMIVLVTIMTDERKFDF